MTPWRGNIMDPAGGIVADGHLLFPLDRVKPSAWGVLLQRPDESEFPPRDTVPSHRAWSLWDERIAQPGVVLGFADTYMYAGGLWLAADRIDSVRVWFDPHLVVFARGCTAFTSISQHGDEIGCCVLWRDREPVGLLMPLSARLSVPLSGERIEAQLVRPDPPPVLENPT